MFLNDVREALMAGLTPKQRIAVYRTVLLSLLVFYVFWSCGWLSKLGMLGFAKAENVQESEQRTQQRIANLEHQITQVGDGVSDMRLEIIEERIWNLHMLRCSEDNRAMRELRAGQVQRNLSKYREQAGYEYRLTPCRDL